MRYRHVLISLFIIFLMLGVSQNDSNYQFQLVATNEIPLGPVEFSSPAADTYQYIDVRLSILYGTTVADPPAGMGADSTATTNMTEGSYVENTYSQLEFASFSSLPTGWSEGYFTVSGGLATSDVTANERFIQTKAYDFSSYDGARLTYWHRAYDFENYLYEGSDYEIWHTSGGLTKLADVAAADANGAWRTGEHSLETTSASVIFIMTTTVLGAAANEQLQTDNWYIYAITEVTYYRFEAVFRFDSVTQALASYALYVDFYPAMSGSDDLDFYIGISTNPTDLIANDKQDDFSTDVTDYITDTPIYLKISDDYRSGDTVQTTAYIARCYLYTPTETVNWYDNDWLYRKQISIVEQSGAGTNYQIPITGYYNDSSKDVAGSVDFEALCQTDFDDIRFAASNGTTLLDYWIDNEGYSAGTSAKFWVEVKADASTTSDDVKIFVYFGNDAVSDVSSGPNTFMFYDDFETNDFTRWTTNTSTWSIQGTTKKYGSYAAVGVSTTTNSPLLKTFATAVTYSFIVHQWFRAPSAAANEYNIFAQEADATIIYAMYSPANEFSTFDTSQHDYFANGQAADTWHEIELVFDFTTSLFKPYIDSVHKTDQDMDSTAGAAVDVTDVKDIGARTPNAVGSTLYLDDYYIRKWIATEPTFAAPANLEYQDLYAPVIQAVSYSPINPTTATGLTLFAIVTDADIVEMHSVSFAPLAYPDEFNASISMDATEVGTNTWSYTIAAEDLYAGVYCFVTTAQDTVHSYVADYTQYHTIYVTPAEEDQMTAYIVIFDNLGNFIPFETFAVYRNGARQYNYQFQCYDYEPQNITIEDRWGETLNTTEFDAGTIELVVVINVYSLKFMSWYNGFAEVNITHGGVTYGEIIMPMEIIEFMLYNGSYTYEIDYLNGTTSGSYNIDMVNSTGVIITGDSITDIMSMSEQLWDLVYEVNVTITATNNYVLTISIDLDNVNTTINNQLIEVLLDISNTNTTIYDQTVSLLASIQNTNTTIYAQLVNIIADLDNVNSTIYSQTITILANIANLDSDIAAQTVTLLASLSNINSSIYAQTVDILADISNVNTTLYAQAIEILSDISNTNSTIYSQTISILSYVLDTNTAVNLVLDPDVFHILFASFSFSDEFSHFYGMSNWHNATVTIYENDVQMVAPFSELVVPVLYALSTSPGTYNVSAKFVSGANTAWYNTSYTIAEVIAFKLSEWDLDLHLGIESFVEGYVLTTWENATIRVYDNGTLMVTVLEGEGGTSFYWWMAQQQGIHNIVLNITNGVTTVTKTRSYFIPDWAVTGLVARYDIWNYQENGTSLYLESNWGNCTVSVYLNGTLVATSSDDPAQVFFDRTTNVGTFNLSIAWNGGTQIYTLKNIDFTVTEEGTTYISGGFSEITYNYTYSGDTYENPPGLYIDQGTAAVIVIGALPIALIAYLAGREFLRGQKIKTERKFQT